MSQSNTEQKIEVKAKPGKYLTFKLGKEIYGIEILKVQEIIGMMNVTEVPKTPHFVRGVINLRGKVIPVISLREKFTMQSIDDTSLTCIIVVQIKKSDGRIVTMGVIVDEVSEVLNIELNELEACPEFGLNVDTEFILGMGKVGDKVIMLLDVNRVLSNGEIQLIDGIN